MYYTVLYCSVLYSTLHYCTLLYCTILYCTLLSWCVWSLTVHTGRRGPRCSRHLSREAGAFDGLGALLDLVLVAAAVGGDHLAGPRLHVNCGTHGVSQGSAGHEHTGSARGQRVRGSDSFRFRFRFRILY